MSERAQLTITMQGIADLAQVQRTAVTQWRTRYPETSSIPFPAPVSSEQQLLFDAQEVAKWLAETEHGNNPEAVEDAPFYSALFNQAKEMPAVWAALLAHSRVGEDVTPGIVREQLFLDGFVPGDVLAGNLTEAAEIANVLAESAYSAATVLDRLNRPVQPKEELVRSAQNFLAAMVKEVITDQHSTEVVACGPGADSMLALSTNTIPQQLHLHLSEPGVPAYCAAAHGHGIENETDEFSPNAVVLMQWISATTSDAQDFFDQLDDALLGLDETGIAIVVAPAEFLIYSKDATVEMLRRNLLFSSGEQFRTSLRYSALLPQGWSLNLGRRQLALWALRRPAPGISSPEPVVLADHSALDVDSNEPQRLISDVLVALNREVPAQLHAFLRAKVVAEDQVRLRDSLRPRLVPEATDEPAPSIVDLRGQAEALGLSVIEDQSFQQAGNPYELHKRKVLPWDIAAKGSRKVVRVLQGSRLPSLRLDHPEGTVAVLGTDELLRLKRIGERSAEPMELAFKINSYSLTEPGDVVVLPSPKVRAIVDRDGGKLVEAPAQIIRCKQFAGRSKTPLDEVAVPELLANEINASGTKDKSLWMVPVLPREQAAAFANASRTIEARKQQLAKQLEGLTELQNNLGEALLAGTIRGAPG